MINPVVQSKIDYLIQQRKNQYATIQTLRDYADGEHTHILTDDEKVRLVGADSAGNPARDVEFHLNVCKTVLDVEVDRLEVRDIKITVPTQIENADGTLTEDTDPAASQDISKWANKRWKANRLDEGQRGAHRSAARDGDSFGIVYFDAETQESRIALHQVYDGQQSGVDMFYADNDPQQPLYAVKIWIAKDTQSVKVRRKNVYYHDRVEKWISDGGMTNEYRDADWRPLNFTDDDWTDDLVETPALYSDSGETATVVWWTETKTAPQYNERGEWVSGGKPLGLPVFHFRHEADGDAYGVSTIDCLVPGGQDAINDAALSVLVAQKLAGYKVNWATGFDPRVGTFTTYPGATVYNPEPDGSFGQFSETDLRQLVEVKDTFIKDAATLTATPLTYFNLTGVIPAEGTQQSLESALLAKTRRNQTSYGNTWEDIFRYMLKLEKTWTQRFRAYTPETLAQIDINTIWEPGEMSNDRDEAEIAQIHKNLGVPDRFVWAKLGYTEDQIEQFGKEREEARAKTIGGLAQRIAAMEASNNGTDDTADQPVS